LSKATRKAATILILALALFRIVALSIRIVTLRDAIEVVLEEANELQRKKVSRHGIARARFPNAVVAREGMEIPI